MKVVIGSARSDERGQYSGGKRGDQRQTKAPDYTGEVSLQNFYLHRKGWRILRPKYAHVAGQLLRGPAITRTSDTVRVTGTPSWWTEPRQRSLRTQTAVP